MYKIRVILDVEEDVIRTIMVEATINLEKLHKIIADSFGFEGHEMASFFRTDDDWNQGEEIPLFDMAEAGKDISMQDCILKETLPMAHSKLIYVYDFINMWTFYVEVLEINKTKNTQSSQTILSIGQIPEKSPEKQFVAENLEDEFKEEFGNDDFLENETDDFDQYNDSIY